MTATCKQLKQPQNKDNSYQTWAQDARGCASADRKCTEHVAWTHGMCSGDRTTSAAAGGTPLAQRPPSTYQRQMEAWLAGLGALTPRPTAARTHSLHL
jgi:hypothetical protein